MTDVIGVGGEPATGKTTLMRELLTRLPGQQDFEYGTLHGHLFPDEQLVVFGTYTGQQHDGTDALAMNVITDARAFLDAAVADDTYSEYTVLFEGDRLYNSALIEFVATTTGLRGAFLLLTAPQDVLQARHDQRGTTDTQDDTWLQGRRTKYANLSAEYGTPTDTSPELHDTEPRVYERRHADRGDTENRVTELLSLADVSV